MLSKLAQMLLISAVALLAWLADIRLISISISLHISEERFSLFEGEFKAESVLSSGNNVI